MRLQNPLATVITVGMDSQVLHVLAGTDQFLSASDITRLLPEQGTRPGVQKSLVRLAEQGIVTDTTVGRSRAYTLNRHHLLADAVLAMTGAPATLVARTESLIAGWSTLPTTVVLFGSAARGEMRNDSDLDFLVVMPDEADDDATHRQIHDLAAAVSSWTGNDVRPLVYRESEVTASPIFYDVLNDGVHVTGDRSWLRRHLRSAGLRSGRDSTPLQ